MNLSSQILGNDRKLLKEWLLFGHFIFPKYVLVYFLLFCFYHITYAFRVNLHYVIASLSNNFLFKTSAISEEKLTSTRVEITNTYLVNGHWIIWSNWTNVHLGAKWFWFWVSSQSYISLLCLTYVHASMYLFLWDSDNRDMLLVSKLRRKNANLTKENIIGVSKLFFEKQKWKDHCVGRWLRSAPF